ncbi:MAG: 2Fe-2S iron-sulfur cluster-binding protein [Hyphomonadaceae bacterium]|nr:2Fe-2S iron-sulfur cluster-binding protein [Hyphomonadaceae bacterium]
MLKLHVTDTDGSQAEVEGKVGYSVMEVLKSYNYTGIEAVCGGSCSCATCHVIIDPEWFDRLPPRSETEVELLTQAPSPEATYRLSCQILLSEELNGMKLRIGAPAAS